MPKTTNFSHLITKQSAKTLKFQYFYSVLQKKILWAQTKTGRIPCPRCHSCAWADLWPAATRTLSTLQSFQSFLRHNVGNPVTMTTSLVTMTKWHEATQMCCLITTMFSFKQIQFNNADEGNLNTEKDSLDVNRTHRFHFRFISRRGAYIGIFSFGGVERGVILLATLQSKKELNKKSHLVWSWSPG